MGYLPTVTGEFFVVTEPEMRFSDNNGDAVVRARARVDNSRRKQDGSYTTNGDPGFKEMFVTLSGWRGLAERFANEVSKNTPLKVTGQISERHYTTQQRENRSEIVVDMESFEVVVRRNQQGGQQNNHQQGGQQGYNGGNQQQQGNRQGGYQNGQQGGYQQGNQQQGGNQQNTGWPADDGGAPPF